MLINLLNAVFYATIVIKIIQYICRLEITGKNEKDIWENLAKYYKNKENMAFWILLEKVYAII